MPARHIARYLSGHGYRVQQCADGEEALGQAERRAFDVAVLDLAELVDGAGWANVYGTVQWVRMCSLLGLDPFDAPASALEALGYSRRTAFRWKACFAASFGGVSDG